MREKLKRSFFILTSMSIFILVLLFIGEEYDEPKKIEEKTHYLPKVSYISSSEDAQASSIFSYGVLKPKWDITLKSQVNGAITYINPLFESGSLVTSNTVLMHIEDKPYKSQKSKAEVAFAEAKLGLIQAKKKTENTNRYWELSGIDSPPSDLALFKPQLDIAEKALEAARQDILVADSNLSYTHVKAPFKGTIIERKVGLGQQVVEGEPLLRLIDHQNFYLPVFLSEMQWKNLSNQWLNSKAKLYLNEGEVIADATIISGGYHLDSETRQYPLFMEVNSAQNDGLISGQFIKVRIAGKIFDNYLSLPESALTQDGAIWFIDHQDTLRFYEPKDIHYQDKHVLVPAPDKTDYLGQKIWRVATVPLSFFLAGQRVEPIEVLMEK